MVLSDVAILAALFASAFTSATILPGSSEIALAGLVAAGDYDRVMLVAVATAGNVAGSMVNYGLGRIIERVRHKRWFPVDAVTYEKASAWYARYGVWSLLLAWLPIVGDPLTVVAGALRVRLSLFVLLVTLGKAGRYIAIALAVS